MQCLLNWYRQIDHLKCLTVMLCCGIALIEGKIYIAATIDIAIFIYSVRLDRINYVNIKIS